MPNTLPHTARIIKLSGKKITRSYEAEIYTAIEEGDKKSSNHMGLYFSLAYIGLVEQDMLMYHMKVQKRFLISKKYTILKRLTKVQKLALEVAALNDDLELQVDKHFNLVKVTNTAKIREKWQVLRSNILVNSPDLKDMVADFDWQLKEENIQQLFLEDNFFNFLFSNIYNRDSEENKPIVDSKKIANALGNLSIPIIEEKKITKPSITSSELLVKTEAQLATENKKFPMAKLNVFLGNFVAKGTEYSLDFGYSGSYVVNPEKGLVIKGALKYHFDLKDLHKKTTTINFNLKKDE